MSEKMTKLCLTESEKNSLILAVFANVVEHPFDVFVIVEGFSIPCHRIILSAASSVFKKHFAGCGCNKISLLGVKYQDVHDILLLFYTGSIQADVSRLTELRKTHKKLGILIPFEELIKSMEVEEAATENHKSNDVSSNALVSCTSSPALDLQNCTPKPAENVEESAKVESKLPTSAVATESVSVQKAVSLPKMLTTRRASAKQSREKLLPNIPRKILAITKPPSIVPADVEELKQKEMIMKHLERLPSVDQKKGGTDEDARPVRIMRKTEYTKLKETDVKPEICIHCSKTFFDYNCHMKMCISNSDDFNMNKNENDSNTQT